MSLSLKSPHPSIEWLGEPELAFAHGLTHIDPKVGIPASGPWSLNEANHPASVTAGFIGTAECMDKAGPYGFPARPKALMVTMTITRSAVSRPAGRSPHSCARTGQRRTSPPARSAT